MPKCARCGKEIADKAAYLGKELVCRDCMNKAAQDGNNCPCCGAYVSAEDAVGMLLARPNASPAAKAIAKTIVAIVCPQCGSIFVDRFNYQVLEGIKNTLQ